MTKEQIISKIVQDLPTSDMLGEMNGTEWYGWFEECWDKAINFKHCCTELCEDWIHEERVKQNDDKYCSICGKKLQ